MRKFNEMPLSAIRAELEKVGVKMTDDQFSNLSHSELKKIFRKANKAFRLESEVNAIINKKPTPATIADKTVEKKQKTTKGA